MPPVLRSNPIYTEEEEQEVVIIVDSLEAPEVEVPDAPRVPRRAPSTSSGYGSGGGSHGRVSPTVPKIEHYEPEPTRRLSDCEKNEGSHTTSDSEGSPSCTLSRSLKDDIRSCLGGCSEYRCSPGVGRWEREVEAVVAAAARGAGGPGEARARLQAALRALHEPALRYCGPGVRPGDVTMLPKNNLSLLVKASERSGAGTAEIHVPKLWYYSEMLFLADVDVPRISRLVDSILDDMPFEDGAEAASALFTLDGARGEALARRLARGEKRRRRCRAALAIIGLLLLLAAVCAVELLMSRGQRVFGAVIR